MVTSFTTLIYHLTNMPNIDPFDADQRLTSIGRKVSANITAEEAERVEESNEAIKHQKEVDDFLKSLFLA